MNLLGEALNHYAGPVSNLDWAAVKSDGLSGASLWCGSTTGRPLILAKAHHESVDAEKLQTVHAWQTVAVRSGLNFVPGPVPASNGRTLTETGGRIWEFLDWMPGEPCAADDWNEAKLAEACDAVGRLHRVWRTTFGTRVEPCRAAIRRLEILNRWIDRPLPLPESERIVIERRIRAARERLLPWATRAVRCRPCVRDLRSQHFLFRGDRLTGLIDFAASDWDAPAVDAARLLGEFRTGRDSSLDRLIPALDIPADQRELVILLDWTGTLASLMNWWERLETPASISIPIDFARARIAELRNRLAFAAFAW